MRLSVGPRYRAANARSLADLPQNTKGYLIAESEVPGGSVVWGRVFVVPDGGDELASNAVKLTR